MAYEHSRHALTAEGARLLKHSIDEATGNEFLVVAFTGLERDYFEEYKSFFNTFTWPTNYEAAPNTPTRLIDQPEIGAEAVPFPGAWMRSSVTSADDESSELILTLLRVYDSVKDGAGNFIRAGLLNKDQYRSSESGLVLEFRNIDPRAMDSIVKADLVDESYADIVTQNQTYPGSWYNPRSSQRTDESGAGVITWFVTKHNNEDSYYRFQRAPTEVEVQFFKYNMLPAGKTDVENNYYFDAAGMYYSADGAEYTKLDGVAVDPSVPLPDTAKLLSDIASARVVNLNPQRREDDHTTDLSVQIVFSIDPPDRVHVFMANPSERHVHFTRRRMDPSAYEDFKASVYFDPDGDYYYSADGINYTKKNDDDEAGVLPETAQLLSETVSGRTVDPNESVREADGTVDLHVQIIFSIDLTIDGGDDGAGGRYPLVTFGDALEEIIYDKEFTALEIPNGGIVDKGVVEDPARGSSMTVTRYDLRWVDGRYRGRKMITRYKAPIHDATATGGTADDWFYHKSAALVERDSRSFYSAVTDPAGNTGFQPIDGNLRLFWVLLPTKRPKNVLAQQKHFVCRPTDAMLTGAGITKLTDENEDPTTIPLHQVRQLGKHHFCLEMITTTLGAVTQDMDQVIDLDHAVYQGTSVISQTEIPAPP